MKFKIAEAETAPMTFRCKADLRAAIEWAAANEGISSSDVIRRAVMSDVRRRKAEVADVEAGGEKRFEPAHEKSDQQYRFKSGLNR